MADTDIVTKTKEYTDEVRTAIYGKEVRSAIADSIDGIAQNVKDEIARDTLATNVNTNTNSIISLNDSVDSYLKRKIVCNFAIGTISSTGSEATNTKRMRSDFIEIKQGDIITTDEFPALLYEYDADKTFIINDLDRTYYEPYTCKNDGYIRIVSFDKDAPSTSITTEIISEANNSFTIMSQESCFKLIEDKEKTHLRKLLDTNFSVGFFNTTNGQDATNTKRIVSEYIKVEKDYVISSENFHFMICEYNSSKTFIQSDMNYNSNYIVQNDGYIRIGTWNKEDATEEADETLINSANADFYIMSQESCFNKINIINDELNKIEKRRVLYCGTNREYTTLKAACEEGVKEKGTIVYIDSETFNLIDEFGTDYFTNMDNTVHHRGIQLYNDIELIFASGSKVIANYEGTNANVNMNFSIFNSGGSFTGERKFGGFTIKNANLYGKNIRYLVHDEHGGDLNPYTTKILGCQMHLDNSANTNWQCRQCIGGGLAKNGNIIIKHNFFESVELTTGYKGLVTYHNSGTETAVSSLVIDSNYFAGNNATFGMGYYGDYEDITQAFVSNNSFSAAPFFDEGDYEHENIHMTLWNNEIRS